jgi:hypothetical protein
LKLCWHAGCDCCHLGLARRYRRPDKREHAQKQVTTATTMYREMGMRF